MSGWRMSIARLRYNRACAKWAAAYAHCLAEGREVVMLVSIDHEQLTLWG
jgi:hypothetical protein